MIKRDPKKGTKEYTNKFCNIGFVDESNLHNLDQPINSASGFTITNQIKGL